MSMTNETVLGVSVMHNTIKVTLAMHKLTRIMGTSFIYSINGSSVKIINVVHIIFIASANSENTTHNQC